MGRILDLRVLSETGLSRPSSNQSYMDPSGKAHIPLCAFSQAIPMQLLPGQLLPDPLPLCYKLTSTTGFWESVVIGFDGI